MNREMQVDIRPFKEGDQDKVRQLILDGLIEHFDKFDPSLNFDLDNITLSYLEKGNYVAVAERGGNIVGAGALVTETGQRARIVRVSISRIVRREGIGTKLVKHLIGEARARNFSEIVVETNHDWDAAIALYEKCRFVRYASDEESIHMVLTL